MENKFDYIEKKVKELGFRINSKDFNRPWGGFLVIDEDQSDKFIDYFFQNLDMSLITKGLKLSPKILIVKPLSRLSWQYHYRRSEIWKVFEGEVAVVRSENDNEQPKNIFPKGSLITLKQGERHRLIGLNDFGVVAEIWQHTDVNNPSNENDIVRIQDDYGR
ncbi:phosphoheptose isomerase [Flavobacteriaceae bacterium]|jgi:mannose-6-phosphate isomerase-like protein (cupin superfamily)|nr:phosphoheptose isomerase [Flavobacteriales bacterium]MBL6878187.1 phosphoheptose isomerase [Flavobacteriaceae bacterium]MDA9850407.1 phosphoheptose isomerase [Flavobacteriaceae bacterium]